MNKPLFKPLFKSLSRPLLLPNASLYTAIGLLGVSLLKTPLAIADSVVLTEQKMLAGLTALSQLDIEQAVSSFSEISSENPKYKLAHLVAADLQAIKSGQKSLLNEIHRNHSRSVEKLLDEAEVRWQFSKRDYVNSNEFNHLVLKSAQQKHMILVSIEQSRLFLFERNAQGKMTQVADYYVTIGRKGSGKQKEGDLRTPIGVYHMVDLLPGEELPDLYGVGALPINYPNDWDKKNGKTGSGIWLHGVPQDTYTRPPRASRGCVVLNNDAMNRLLTKYDVPFSTPVIISDKSLPELGIVPSKNSILAEIKSWLKDHQHDVSWDKVSVYRYPNEKGLYYVTFPDKAGQNLVHQYWELNESGKWQVVLQSHDLLNIPNEKVEKKA